MSQNKARAVWLTVRDWIQDWLYSAGVALPSVRTRLAKLKSRFPLPSEGDTAAEDTGGYLADVVDRARNLGVSPLDIVRRDRAEVRAARDPDSPCLTVGELEHLTREKAPLVPARQAHLDACSLCQSLVARARMNADGLGDVAKRLATLPDWLVGSADATPYEFGVRTRPDSVRQPGREVYPLGGPSRPAGSRARPTRRWVPRLAALAAAVILAAGIGWAHPDVLRQVTDRVVALRDARQNLARAADTEAALNEAMAVLQKDKVTREATLAHLTKELARTNDEVRAGNDLAARLRGERDRATADLRKQAKANTALASAKDKAASEAARLLDEKEKLNTQIEAGKVRSDELEKQNTDLRLAAQEAARQNRLDRSVASLADVYLSRHVNTLSFSPDDRLLAAVNWRGQVQVWDTDSGEEKPFPGLARPGDPTDRLTALAFAPAAGQFAVGTRKGVVALWDQDTRRYVWKADGPAGVIALAFSPDGKHLATATLDGAVRLLNAASGLDPMPLPEPSVRVTSVAFSRDGRVLATAGLDRGARLFSMPGGAPARTTDAAKGVVTSASFSPVADTLAVAHLDGTIGILDIAQGKDQQIRRFRGGGGPVSALAYSRDGKWLATATVDGGIRLLQADDGRPIRAFGTRAKEKSEPMDR